MKIKTECPHCHASFSVDENMTGKNVNCPKCKSEFTIHPIGKPMENKKNESTDNLYEVIDSLSLDDGTSVEVVQFRKLSGSADLRVAHNLYFAERSGMSLKMVRIKLKDTHIRVEPGALYFMKGSLEMKTSTGGGVMKGLARKMLTKESFFVNEIHGSGDIYLEPSFGHFILYHIKPEDKAVIVDKGLFYAGTAGLTITAVMQKNISSAAFGGEGLFQTSIKGDGIAVLYSPVPRTEIEKFELDDDKLSVDGNFALMRTEGVNFRTEKSSKTWLATSVSGEGLLQTFSGTGTVWIAPTQGIYERLATDEGIAQMSLAPGSMNTRTETSSKKRK